MKQLTIPVMAMLLSATSNGLMACGTEDDMPVEAGGEPTASTEGEPTMETKLAISVGGATFDATLADNEAARSFAALLPLTVEMHELNGNEKYHYLSESLPTAAVRPGTIREGDLMLYGATCVVLFYKTFTTGYSYTPLGRVNHPGGLSQAAGEGNVEVRFELVNP